MDINTLAAWGEFLGGIAVVVSLIYLASQFGQTAKLLRVSTTASTHQLRFSPQALIVQDADIARIFWQGIADRDSLSEEDRRQFDPLVQMYFFVDNQSYQFQQDGIISALAWENAEQELRWKVEQPGLRQWWREWSRIYPQVFKDYVDGLIRDGEAAG